MAKYRLTEGKLRNIIKESVRQMINELDITSMPTFGDARDRDAWWKEQALKDFPEYKYNINQHQSNFQELYYQLRANKEKSEKLRAKKERETARQAKKDEQMRNRQEKMQNRQNMRKLFLHAVNYVILGEDSLMSSEQIMNDIDNEIPEDWYDGVTKMPVVLKGDRQPRWATIHGFGKGHYTDGAFISLNWGIEVNGIEGDEGVMSIDFNVFVDDRRNQIYFEITETDNDLLNIRATEQVATKYLNGVIKRQVKNAAAKVEKYGTADVVGF